MTLHIPNEPGRVPSAACRMFVHDSQTAVDFGPPVLMKHFRIDLQIFVHTTTSNQTRSHATFHTHPYSTAVDPTPATQLKEELLARGDAAPGRLKSVLRGRLRTLIINAHTASHSAARKRARES